MRLLVLSILFAAGTAFADTPYAKLFVPDAHWTYAVDETVKPGDGAPIVKHTDVACRVTTVRRVASSTVSLVACDGESTWVAGTWISTLRGLWQLYETDASQPIPTPAQVRSAKRLPMIIAAKPRARTCRETNAPTGECTAVEKRGATWCVKNDVYEANGAYSSTICFADGAIASIDSDGSTYSDGGVESSTTVRLVP